MVLLAKAVFKFEGAQSDDLSFDEDEVITILHKDDSGWWTGKNEEGKEGDFPYNYVEVMSEAEAQAYLKEQQSGPDGEMSFQGDRIDTIEIAKLIPAEGGKPGAFEIESSTTTGKAEKVTKTIVELRQFDDALRRVVPNFEGKLPPQWADFGLGLLEKNLEARKEAMETYVQKLVATDGADFLLVPFLFPGKSVDLNAESFALAEKASKQAKETKKNEPMGAVELARAEYPWEAMDPVELNLEVGEVVCVVSQNTGSDGWWEGQLADGSRGMFPYNHVEVLSAPTAKLFLEGKPLPAMAPPEAQLGERVKKDHIPTTTERKILKVPNFTLATLQAFDDMIDKGFAVENVTGTAKGGGPKVGDKVELAFRAHIWDGQLLSILEFLASEDKGEGPLEFVVGDDPGVCQGLHQAVQKFNVGESGRIIIAPRMGYGVAGSPPVIPPLAHLVYEITLLKVSDASAASAATPRSKPEVKARKETGGPRVLSMRMLNPVKNRTVSEKKPNAVPISTAPSTSHAPAEKRLAGHVMMGEEPASVTPAAATPEMPKFELKELQEIFTSGKVGEKGLNPATLEDYLNDKAFFEAFLMDRGHFLLKPRWRQDALKRAVGLL